MAQPNYAFTMELSVADDVPDWGHFVCALEEDVVLAADGARVLRDRQTAIELPRRHHPEGVEPYHPLHRLYTSECCVKDLAAGYHFGYPATDHMQTLPTIVLDDVDFCGK